MIPAAKVALPDSVAFWSAALLDNKSLPVLTLTVPLMVLAPARFSVPLPLSEIDCAPLMPLEITPLTLSVPLLRATAVGLLS